MTWEELESAGFPDEVTEALRCITYTGDRPYLEYIRQLRHNEIARKVKLADLRHNSDLTRLDKVDEAAKARLARYRKAEEILREL